MKFPELKKILRRLYFYYIKNHINKIILALILSVGVAVGSMEASAHWSDKRDGWARCAGAEPRITLLRAYLYMCLQCTVVTLDGCVCVCTCVR